MAVYSTNEMRGGMKILLDGDPYAIIENEFVKPGKGQAFNRVKMRNLKNGRVLERNFKSGDTAEVADVTDQDMQYLYSDGQFWYFMVPDTFEQIAAGPEAVADVKQWLKEEMSCIVTLWNGVPLYVAPPNHVELKIVETDPGVRGDTATGGQKPAKLETGAVVRVPLFINEGEVIRVDTRTGTYISRVKHVASFGPSRSAAGATKAIAACDAVRRRARARPTDPNPSRRPRNRAGRARARRATPRRAVARAGRSAVACRCSASKRRRCSAASASSWKPFASSMPRANTSKRAATGGVPSLSCASAAWLAG